jgi:GNAT superfamily N-acetyltransferase
MSLLNNIEIRVEEDPESEVIDEIETYLIESLGANSQSGAYKPVAVLARDPHNDLVGGLVGSTSYGWFLVKMLWVADAARGQGLGTHLMKEGELEALRRGCHAAWLDTSSARARRFYERLGFAVFGTLQNEAGDQPQGHCRWFLSKRLKP